MAEQTDVQPRRKRRHGAKNTPVVPKHHNQHIPVTPLSNQPVLPESMREVVTDAGTFVFDDTLSPSISYFLFRPDQDEVSEAFEQNVLAGEPLNSDTLQALHYIAELRLSDGWQTLMADLFIDRDLASDHEVHEIVESTLVLLDDIEPGPEGTALTVYWVQEIGVFTPDSLEYEEPVSSLLIKGEPETDEWEDYLALGFQDEHIPELIRMAVDTQLHWSRDPVQNFAPVHAWRALGQLRAVEAIYPLLTLADMSDEWDDRDYIIDELDTVFGMIGPPAIDPLTDFARNRDGVLSLWTQIWALIALKRVAEQHPKARSRVIQSVCSCLDEQLNYCTRHKPDEDDTLLNGFIVGTLSEMEAIETLPLIRKVFEAGIIESFPCGTLEEVEIQISGSAEAD